MGVQIKTDTEGEVLARANHVFAGYWEQPEESARALEGGWFHTGDGGYLDGAYLVISDRKKDVIITGGENVSSIEVEDCLYQHSAVAEVAVIGVPDEKWGETIKALVVVRDGETVTEAELIAHCRDRLRTSRRRPAWSCGTRSTGRRRGSCRSTSSDSHIGRDGSGRSASARGRTHRRAQGPAAETAPR